MRTHAAIMGVILLHSCSGAGTSQVQGRALRQVLEGRIGPALASYRAWDAANRDGLGLSDQKTSGGLGWGESTYLRNYMLCYQVTGDTYWLDKVIDHFDRMVGNLSDPDGDGYLAWSDTAYSVGLVHAEPIGDVGALTIEPQDQRPYVGRGGELVTGHEYRLEFLADDRLVVKDVTSGEEVATVAYTDPTVVEAIPGAKLTVKGPGRAGAAFRITTHAPEACEYQVHDGMVAYPVAQFVETALTNTKLPEKYRAKAQDYARLLQQHFFEKWESTWVDLADGSGVYRFTKNPTQRFPGYSLPHNQFLALGRTWLVLQAVPGLDNSEAYRDRALKMARYFQQNLRRNGEAYVWNYWDPLPTEVGISRHIEDAGHATIDIGFAVEAAARGVVFTLDDLKRFAATYTQVMWNGSLEDPRIGDRVDTNQGQGRTWSEWIQLGRASEAVCDVAAALYVAQGRPLSMAPQLAALYDAVIGVSEADLKAYTQTWHAIEATLSGEDLPNAGFEFGTPEIGPFGWTLTTWTPDEGGSAKLVDEAHNGAKAIALVAGSDKVNVVAHPIRRLRGQSGQKIAVTVFYRTTGEARPGFSILTYNQAGDQIQYDSSPPLPPADTWKQGTWSVSLAEGAAEFLVLLRNHGNGAVYYDDVALRTD